MRPSSRRQFLIRSAAAAALLQLRREAWGLGLAGSSPVCSLVPEEEEGPYYIAGELLRGNIREGKPGLPLTLRLAVMNVHTCRPLPQAAIDVWHCDALGVYAGFGGNNPMGMGPGGPPPGMFEGPSGGGSPGPPPGFDQHPGRPEVSFF